jgi:hypothetical protein
VSKRLEEIARRKQSLVEKAERERNELAAAYDRIHAPLEITSTLFGIGRTLKTHPIIAAGISSLVVSGYAGKLLKSSGALLRLWRVAWPLWSRWRARRKT